MSVQQNLFSCAELRQPPLTAAEKTELVDKLLRNAKLGRQYLYSVAETASLLHLSIDEIQGLIYSYHLDCTRIRTTLRVPWWSIAEYVLDPALDLDDAVNEYLKSLPHKEQSN